jgi:hypothetical protein
MKVFKFLTLAALIALGGCAATVQKGDVSNASTSGSRTASSAAPKVNIPQAASKRLVLNMSGSKVSTEARDWVSFKDEWRSIFQEQTKAAGIQFEWQDGAPRPLGQNGTLLVVNINDYRFVGIGSRVMLGIMTGNAYIDAQLQFRDLNDGKMLGQQAYNTTSSAKQGVFSAVTPKQIYAIADEVIRDMKAR